VKPGGHCFLCLFHQPALAAHDNKRYMSRHGSWFINAVAFNNSC
jgi:hypothetical protein